MRLESCKASMSRGTSGSAGVRALQLLRALLVTGPDAVLSFALDLIPTVRALMHLGLGTSHVNNNSNSGIHALEFVSLGKIK